MKPAKSNEISARKKTAAQAAEACVDVFGGTWVENIIRSSEMRYETIDEVGVWQLGCKQLLRATYLFWAWARGDDVWVRGSQRQTSDQDWWSQAPTPELERQAENESRTAAASVEGTWGRTKRTLRNLCPCVIEGRMKWWMAEWVYRSVEEWSRPRAMRFPPEKKNEAQAAEACVDVSGGTWVGNIVRSSEMRHETIDEVGMSKGKPNQSMRANSSQICVTHLSQDRGQWANLIRTIKNQTWDWRWTKPRKRIEA